MPVIVGGIIPPDDADTLRAAGVAAVYTPKDFELNRIMADIVRIVDTSASEAAALRHVDEFRHRLRQRGRAHRLRQKRIHAGRERGFLVARARCGRKCR